MCQLSNAFIGAMRMRLVVLEVHVLVLFVA
jgi:hypothetical protein